ncbi:molybdenum cofactor biosynthesis protein B [Alkalisalibacterium limincola]|uniref:Molybdenum cofactor biosynthesis protein B n=1 Tax=Alkalisalibacterium limincola TaxID=2699169 RepID=A0A5C8KQ23_9GAMM|nr:molybdenum cofactor biosynthesis protein B [Alkalisalibacterium limincola]TXK62357.1 molybdenum cofactor biosynthesis protein B [Alkalisalibacterium limincola]
MTEATFKSLDIAVLTVSDTRTEADDKSGQLLVSRLQEDGHRLAAKAIVPDDIYAVRAVVSQWIADEAVQVVLTTGGTGITGRDTTPEALRPLFDTTIEGFGELFRMLSFADIKSSTIQSRAIAGLANRTLLFALPGSPGACKLGWDQILRPQLDLRHKPCNFVSLLPRLGER